MGGPCRKDLIAFGLDNVGCGWHGRMCPGGEVVDGSVELQGLDHADGQGMSGDNGELISDEMSVA